MKKLAWFALTLFVAAACGDNDEGARPDAGGTLPDSTPVEEFEVPTPFAVPVSTNGPDQLQSVVAGPDGTFYAAGFMATGVDAPKTVYVAKMTDRGPASDFGNGGIALTGLISTGGADEIDLVVQADGKIVVSATVVASPTERDIGLTRLDAAGAVDTTFGDVGDNGVQTFSLSSMVVPPVPVPMQPPHDAARGLALDATGNIYLHAAMRNPNVASAPDQDFAIVKFSPNGVQDMAFGGENLGRFKLDIRGGDPLVSAGATARGIKVLADGTILAGGYTSSGLVGGTTQIVMYKVDATGALVTAFGENGVYHDIVLAYQTETYNFAVHGGSVVTGGYGRDVMALKNQWVSLKFDATTGDRDTSFGGVDRGAVLIDPSGIMASNNCRNAIALPGGKTLLIGSGGEGNAPTQDAAFAILAADGTLDEAYGAKAHLLPLGQNGNDAFWGAAVSGNNVMIVGYQGSATATPSDDDSFGIVFPLR